MGHKPALRHGVRCGKHRITCAARLECSRFLQIFAFKEQTCPGLQIQLATGDHRSAMNVWSNTRVRLFDILQINRKCHTLTTLWNLHYLSDPAINHVPNG